MTYHTPDGEPTFSCPDCLDTGWKLADAPAKHDSRTGEVATFVGSARKEVAGDPIPGGAPQARPCGTCNPVAHRRWREGHYNGRCGASCVECQRIRDGKLSVGADIDPETGHVYNAALTT